MYAIIAAVPILLTVVFMVGFNWPAKRALPVSWFCACLVAGFIWKMGALEIGAQTIAGFLSAFETLCIIFGAILLMNVLKQSGAMAAINRIFSNITKDARIQAVIVGYVFAGFIEGAAGFGTPAALAAPILISLGFPPLAAAAVCLIYNSTPVCPGPVGVPTLTASATVADAVKNLGGDPDKFTMLLTKWTCIPHMIGGFAIIILGLCVLCKIFGKNKTFKDVVPAIPFCLFTGGVIAVIYLTMAIFAGPELTSMVAFLGSLPIVIFAAKKGFLMPKEVWTFEGMQKWGDKSWMSTKAISETRDKGMSAIKAWLPYIIIGIVLVLTRVAVFKIKPILNDEPFILHVDHIFGFENINWDFKFLWNPGILPFMLIALLTIFVHKMTKEEAKLAITDSFKQISGAAVALLFGVAMVNLYRYTNSADIGAKIVSETVKEFTYANSSMLYVMADALANIFHSAYFIVAPLIGVLGAFMSGSCTVSNTLFSSLQFETATLLGMSQILIVALQNMGGAIGNMVCVNNIVSVCATTGTSGNEGKLIRTNIVPCIIYCAIVAAIVGIFLAVGVNPMPEIMG
ncbi:L-lactate permease [Hespellia stercorisuis]|uniref:L-lactate permease n=1 Tax=Hespellia stercorisuis DSM 15480 TaxID=1121950 RepID=A0A1M6Q368_9FIRM|nr:L-lactate permease [Hespellia stercorisuis]SHK14682.1 lactate permease [Hespellia stercorisuis DSM 15480]